MTSTEQELLSEIRDALPGVDASMLVLETQGGLPGAFPVSELATAAIASAGLAAARLSGASEVTVDRQLASTWFGMTLDPIGWELPPVWDAVSGDYSTLDGWIRIHANAPRHRAAALTVLGVTESAEAVRAAVSRWTGADLEDAVVEAGGCAAVMKTADEWAHSLGGRAVSRQPVIEWRDLHSGAEERAWGTPTRPLAGVRVLDLTRVLAGPVATRFLALLGADVVRIDPPEWNEGVIPEVMLGKRSARLDLTTDAGRAAFVGLLASADAIVHGYRFGALEDLGFGLWKRQAIRPGLVDVTLDAYGWYGPLSLRRGFDSLIQMSTGIAHAGMITTGADKPVPLPVQANDQATGYLMAAALLSALACRRETGTGRAARLSLARTAQLLLDRPGAGEHGGFDRPRSELFADEVEDTAWGPARRIRVPLSIDGVTFAASGARALGGDEPRWA
ncbi:CoA transferase [Amnibacterium flavum]|uniref:Acyl-CoA transferase n=1 Tax=Amnibacterium flavum TaxID=2173173 RepID=A0A2V1HQ16_9MICO|nr:CoA transferase [Amnibacterium flavum]PVZ94421.1 acyl-CoA transferase [Amnibacterium flavum]